jgi:putative ABC transport system permease protein
MKYARLIFANLLRKKARLILTIGSFAVALFLFTFLAVVKDAFGRGTELAGADRLVVINRVGLIQTLPLAYRDKILAIPGVKDVTHNHWFGGVYQDERNFFPQFAIDVEHHRQVMTEFRVPDDQWNAFVKDQQGAIAGAALAKRFGWKVGDRIPLQNALYGATKTWQFNLDGIYHNDKPGGDESQYWFQWKYFDENVPQAVKSTAGWYVVKLESPDDAANVGKAVDTLFANSSSETKTETESAFQAGFAKQLGNIQFLILTIGGVVFFTLLLVTGNTMAISVRERTGELAVLKAIGFSDQSVLFFVLGEALVIALIGGVLGLGLAILAIPVVGAALNGLLPSLVLSVAVLSMGLVFALLVGAASGLVPGIGAMRLRVVDALRRV